LSPLDVKEDVLVASFLATRTVRARNELAELYFARGLARSIAISIYNVYRRGLAGVRPKVDIDDIESEVIACGLMGAIERYSPDYGVTMTQWVTLTMKLIGRAYVRRLIRCASRLPELCSSEEGECGVDNSFSDRWRSEAWLDGLRVADAAVGIPERERRVFIARIEEGLTFREIASRMGSHETQVRRIFSYAIRDIGSAISQ
jgi:RNA polymerase sigma factor (sigma-70 family)